MKTIVIIFLLLIGCTKDKPLFCWQCRSVALSYRASSRVIDEWQMEICNQPDIKWFEDKWTYTVDTVRVVTICQKKASQK